MLGLRLHPEKTGSRTSPEEPRGSRFWGLSIGCESPGSSRVVGICSKWPSRRAMASIQGKISARTDRRYASLPLDWAVEDLNRVLRGWGNYFAMETPRGSSPTSMPMSTNASRSSPAPSTESRAATGPPALPISGSTSSASTASTERSDRRLRMPAGERCRRAVCERTARTVRSGGGRQPRTSRQRHAVPGRLPPTLHEQSRADCRSLRRPEAAPAWPLHARSGSTRPVALEARDQSLEAAWRPARASRHHADFRLRRGSRSTFALGPEQRVEHFRNRVTNRVTS